MSRLVSLCLLALASPAVLGFPIYPVGSILIQPPNSTVAPACNEATQTGGEGTCDTWDRLPQAARIAPRRLSAVGQ